MPILEWVCRCINFWFFFSSRRRHTRWTGDWSSDVCSSDLDVLDDYMGDQRLKDALFGQGVIAAYGGPEDAGTASIKLMHYQGDLEGQGPVWGYVQGGMGMVSFALADTPPEAGAGPACRRPGAATHPGAGRLA